MDELTREFVAESLEGLDRMDQSLTALETRPDDRLLLDEIFRAVHTIKGSAGFLGFTRLETLSHAGETLLSSLRTRKIAVTSGLISALLELLDSLRVIIRLIDKTGGEGQRRSDEDFATVARLMELNEAGLVSAALGGVIGVTGLHLDLARGEREHGSAALEIEAADAIERRVATQPADRSIRVDVEVLNRLMNQVGELVLARNQLLRLQLPDDRAKEISRSIDAVTSELRETVMRVRLQPVGNLFGKFPRLVRDLARSCGKQVRLEVQGQETGLDKSLIEAIRDPLTHALRNAIDHGIETPQERLRAGKSPEGTIRLCAFQQNGSVIVELTDDGAGISPAQVAAKAVERGFISPACAATMSEQERIELVFEPGLSTAPEVTNLSGRGVGMDVVRADVEEAGGRVGLTSVSGRGTTVRLTLPLTLVIIPALTVRNAGHSFAVPQSALLELTYLPACEAASAFETVGDQTFYRTRSGLVPTIWLDLLLQLRSAEVSSADKHLALLEHDGCRFALLFDEIVGPEEIVVKPISPILRRPGVYSGAAVLGSGDLALILDVAGLRAAAGLNRSNVGSIGEHHGGTGTLPSHCEPVLVYEVVAHRPEGFHTETRVLPLSSVERIELVLPSQIEHVAGRPVLRLAGSVFDLTNEGALLAPSFCGDLIALICVRGAYRHAVLVSRVLGLSEDPIAMGGDDGRLAMIADGVAFLDEPLPVEPVVGVA